MAANVQGGLALARDLQKEHNEGMGDCAMILDVMLPDGSGLELCQTLRADGFRLPILMLTALNTVDDRVAGLKMGADDYLGKPFSFDELLARLEALRRRSRPDPSVKKDRNLTVADLVLDLSSMRLTRGGREIALTAKELALVELLMSAPGRLFSRERILTSSPSSLTRPTT